MKEEQLTAVVAKKSLEEQLAKVSGPSFELIKSQGSSDGSLASLNEENYENIDLQAQNEMLKKTIEKHEKRISELEQQLVHSISAIEEGNTKKVEDKFVGKRQKKGEKDNDYELPHKRQRKNDNEDPAVANMTRSKAENEVKHVATAERPMETKKKPAPKKMKIIPYKREQAYKKLSAVDKKKIEYLIPEYDKAKEHVWKCETGGFLERVLIDDIVVLLAKKSIGNGTYVRSGMEVEKIIENVIADKDMNNYRYLIFSLHSAQNPKTKVDHWTLLVLDKKELIWKQYNSFRPRTENTEDPFILDALEMIQCHAYLRQG